MQKIGGGWGGGGEGGLGFSRAAQVSGWYVMLAIIPRN
jgi:hypothetical protein